jgi:hypothetical protein
VSDRPRLHLIGLPHTTTTDDITVCAYTNKWLKAMRMLGKSYEVVQYWGDRTDAPCAELVTLHTEAERQKWYPGLTPETVATVGGTWDAGMESWQTMNARAILALGERLEEKDIILLAGGLAQQSIAQAFPVHTVCEPGVGYTGWFTNYVCFESHTWRHHCYGGKNIHDGRWYDVVIPNFFEPDLLPVADGKDDYLLFMGRLIARKGVATAGQVAARAGMHLKVAGPGAREWNGKRIVCEDGTVIEGDVEYVGVVGAAERAELMGRARAVLTPTGYIEPFGGVAVEAQMCGTPAITTDWGAFTETVEDGYRFRTLAEGAACVNRALSDKPARLRKRAVAKWSLDAVRPQYERWFDQLHGLWGPGWPA